MREAISVFTENANDRQNIGGRELGEAHILHPERLFLQPLHSQNVFYGNAAKSALSWRLKKHKGEKIFNTELHEIHIWIKWTGWKKCDASCKGL